MIKIIIAMLLCISARADEGEIVHIGLQRVGETARTIAKERQIHATQQAAYVQAFIEGFKSGLTLPDPTIEMHVAEPEDPSSEGFFIGRNMAISNSASMCITLEDYGYIYTNVNGYIFFGFEQSELRPIGTSNIWWIGNNREIGMAYSRLIRDQSGQDLDRMSVVASLSGFLSPEEICGYGHMGAYKREFVIDKINDVKRIEKPQQGRSG